MELVTRLLSSMYSVKQMGWRDPQKSRNMSARVAGLRSRDFWMRSRSAISSTVTFGSLCSLLIVKVKMPPCLSTTPWRQKRSEGKVPRIRELGTRCS